MVHIIVKNLGIQRVTKNEPNSRRNNLVLLKNLKSR